MEGPDPPDDRRRTDFARSRSSSVRAWAKFQGLFRTRQRAHSLPVLPRSVVVQNEAGTAGGGGVSDDVSDSLASDSSPRRASLHSSSRHSFAPEVAGRYTAHHRPVGVIGLNALDSTDGGSDSDSSVPHLRISSMVESASASLVAVNDENSETTTSRANTSRLMTEDTETTQQGAESEESVNSEEYAARSQDLYSFVQGFGAPVGIKGLYKRGTTTKEVPKSE